MYEVRIKGFKTKQAMNEFASWFDGQGEQDCSIWMEEHAGCHIYTEDIKRKFTCPTEVEVIIRQVGR